MKERIVLFLRGPYNSVRYRFIHLPKEWLTYIFRFRLLGHSWIDFYAARLDSSVKIDRPLKDEYIARGRTLFEYIKAHGLKPEHRFLDYGCGVLRTALPLIQYLDDGNYIGVDISGERLKKGRFFLGQNGIEDERYQVLKISDCRLHELAEYRFDFIWAMSVINHMPAKDIRTMLKAMRGLLAADGQYLFVFDVADRPYRLRIKDWWHDEATMRRWCEEAGFAFEILSDYKEEADFVRMARVTIPQAARQEAAAET